MLSYQHSYHAGCFADVMKHAILTRLLNYLIKKESPLLYLDTHSGRGRYDLNDKHALKTKEALIGIQPLWEKRSQLSPLFKFYIDAIENLNAENTLRYYPGSPEIAIQLLREQDRLVFCELHPTEFKFLNRLPHQGQRVFCKEENGLNILNAIIPPIERRGLVFIDPSYERKNEYQEIIHSLTKAYKRCATMTYCVWYPFINKSLHQQFVKGLKTITAKNTLQLEFYINQKSHATPLGQNIGMTGSGLWIINPPYTLAQEGKEMMLELTKIIQPGNASYFVESI